MTNFKDRIFQFANNNKEPAALLVLFLSVYIISSYFDLFEIIHMLISSYEPWELDEFIGTAALFFFIIFIFSVRHRIKLKNEIKEKKQILDELRIRAYQNEIIANLGQSSLSINDLSEFMDKTVNLVARGLGIEYCKILKLLPDGEDFLLVAGIGWKDGSVGKTVVPGGDDSQAGYTLYSEHPVTVKNLQTEERFSGPALLHDHSVISGISTSIKCKEKIYGVIGAHTKKLRNFTQDDINFLQSVANMIATRIDQEIAENEIKGNFNRLYKKSKYESIISLITRNVHKSTRLEDVLENAAQSLSRNMEIAEHVSIFMIEGDDAVLKTSKGLPEWFVQRLGKIPYPKGFTWKVLMEGKLRYCPDVDQDEYIGPAGREVGTRSYLSMPFHYKGKVIGCINLHSFEKNAFSDDEIYLLNIVAQQVETAIGNTKQSDALIESENRYRTIVEHSYDLIVEVSADSKFLFANKNHKEYLGYDPEELIGKSIFDFVHPDDKNHVLSKFIHAKNTLTSSNEVSFRYRHKDGSWRWLNSIGKLFKTASGEDRGVITSRDITERKLEEEKRREIEERYRALVEYSHDLIVEINTKGEFLFVNKNHKDQMGYDPEELIGTSVFDNIHPEDKNAVFNSMITGLENFSNAGIQHLRYKHKNGEYRWLESTGTPFTTSSGETRAVLYSTDITERMKMEEELLKSQKLESLSLLAGGIAHDFNNLLTIVLGNVSLKRTRMIICPNGFRKQKTQFKEQLG